MWALAKYPDDRRPASRRDGRALFDPKRDRRPGLYRVSAILCPELRPGDNVIWDNLSNHKIAVVKTLVQARGAGVLPARLQSGLRAHRNDLCQTQSTPAPVRCAYQRTPPNRRHTRTHFLPSLSLPALFSAMLIICPFK